MQKLDHLEKNLTGRSDKAASTAERDGRVKLEKVLLQHEEAIASLRKEFEMELATSKQQVHRASGFEESYQEVARELTTVQGQLESLTRDLADAHQELAERDKVIAGHTKKVADSKETIDSLKTVINDFSRSVDGYLQDRDEQDQTISSLKEVIADMYRSIDARDEQN
jgi:chromosome segregation ATPase